MIDHLDNLLRHLLLERVDELTDELQVRFQPPDDAWRTYVATLTDSGGAPVNAVNLYLVEVRENVKLRSNAMARTLNEGVSEQRIAPRRIDCHYLVTTWSPATVSPPVEPTLDEHALLYKLLAVLATEGVLLPSAIFGGALPPGFPPELATAELPMTVAPSEGFAKYGEFWGTMGTNHRWKPALHLTVTLPVTDAPVRRSTVVTTRIISYRVGGDAVGPDVRIRIGGWVRDAAAPLPDGSPSPVGGAWVVIESPSGQRLGATETDASGAFTFGDLNAGDFVLRGGAPAHPEITRTIAVPSPTGEYDLTFV